jgi:hypothetical protein
VAGEYAKEDRQTNHEQRNIVHSKDPGLQVLSNLPQLLIDGQVLTFIDANLHV